MNINESFPNRISKHSKRKESASSSKSGGGDKSESESEERFIPIKKEVSNCIIIEKKFFDKLVQYIQKTNTFKQQLKNNFYKQKNKPEYSKILTHEFSIISTNQNKNKNEINSKNDTNKNNNENNKNDNINDNINKANNVNVNNSMMNLFMNSQKGKDKEEISKLKMTIEEMNKKNEEEINSYKEIIKELSSKIESLENEIKKLNNIKEEKKLKENLSKSKIEIIFSNSKLLIKIISYLENNEKINLSKCNSFLYKSLYYKALSKKIYNKLIIKEKILAKFENEDLTSKFEVKENEILELFRNYIINQKISGIEMRNEIVKSLIFLETHVKIPLANFKSPINEKEHLFKMDEPKKPKFFSKFFSALKSEIKEEIGMSQKNEIILNNNFISFTPKEYVNIFDSDRHVLQTFKTDKSLNVKFDYKDADKIKEIINEFFICQLPQASYQKYISKISETFSDLLYASFLALNDIKNLEIIVYALYCRYMKFKLKIEDLQSVIEDLNHYAESSRQIKEMLTKSKNEVEFKYTNSLMTISQLNSNIKEKEEEIKNINLKMKENQEKYDKFKNEIIKEYKKIEDDFRFTKKERDLIKGILNELKDFFIKVVSGELLN